MRTYTAGTERTAGRHVRRVGKQTARKSKSAQTDGRESAVAVGDRALAGMINTESDIAAGRADAANQAGLLFITTLLCRPADVHHCAHALEVFAQDDIDDTRNGIGTIDGRGAVTQYLNALNCRKRQQVQVGLGTGTGEETGRRRRRKSTAVQQDQRVVRTEAAKVYGRVALGAARDAGDLPERAKRVGRDFPEHLRDRHLATGFDVVTCDCGDR